MRAYLYKDASLRMWLFCCFYAKGVDDLSATYAFRGTRDLRTNAPRFDLQPYPRFHIARCSPYPMKAAMCLMQEAETRVSTFDNVR